MKLCNSEIIKKVAELQEKKSKLLNNESNRYKVKYKEGEKKVSVNYSYEKTRDQVDRLDTEVRRLKNLLAKANCTVKLKDFGITIGEGLVMLAQHNEKLRVLESLASNTQLTRETTYSGTVEYTECLFDVEKVEYACESLREEIAKLQVAIDRANLTNMIEIDK